MSSSNRSRPSRCHHSATMAFSDFMATSQLVTSEHIQCITKPSDASQIALRKCSTWTGKQTGHAGKGVQKMNDLKNIRVSWRRQQEQTNSVPSSTDGMSAVSDRPVTSASYDCAMVLSLCRVITNVFEPCVQTLSERLSYRPTSAVNWHSYAWLLVITVVVSGNCYCFKRFRIHL